MTPSRGHKQLSINWNLCNELAIDAIYRMSSTCNYDISVLVCERYRYSLPSLVQGSIGVFGNVRYLRKKFEDKRNNYVLNN